MIFLINDDVACLEVKFIRRWILSHGFWITDFKDYWISRIMDNTADLKVSILEMGPFGMMFRRCDFRIGYYDSDFHFDVFRK